MNAGISKRSAVWILILSAIIIAVSFLSAYAMPDPHIGPSAVGAVYGASVGVFVGAYGLFALITGRG